MISPVRSIYSTTGMLNRDSHVAGGLANNTMTVEAFCDYASEINAFDFEKKYKRPMNASERDLAIQTKSVCHSFKNYMRIFKNITLLSDKYMGYECYVVYRAHQLMYAPLTFHYYKVSEDS